MFIEAKKKEVEKKLIDAVQGITRTFFFDNWSKILVYNYVGGMIYGEFIVVLDDGTFIEQKHLSLYSRLGLSVPASYSMDFARIANEAFDGKYDKKNPTNVQSLELYRTCEYQVNYYENLPDYECHGTPYYVWKYYMVGVNKQPYGVNEASKFIKKYNIIPKEVLKEKIYNTPLKILVENMLHKQILDIAYEVKKSVKKIYFHLDNLGEQKKFSLYLYYIDGTLEKIERIAGKSIICDNEDLDFELRMWLEDFEAMHTFCEIEPPYVAFEYMYDNESREIKYIYDNITGDKNTDPLTLLKEWKTRNFSNNPMRKLINKITNNEKGKIVGTMRCDKKVFNKEAPEMNQLQITAQEFEGDDIHELMPLYFQSGYSIVEHILPDDFDYLYFYTEDDGHISKQLGYVVLGEKYIALNELPKYNFTTQEVYDKTMEALKNWSMYFRNAFIKCEQEPWTIFSYTVDNEGHISTDFKYIPLDLKEYDNEIFDLWRYQNLGIKSRELSKEAMERIEPEHNYKMYDK